MVELTAESDAEEQVMVERMNGETREDKQPSNVKQRE